MTYYQFKKRLKHFFKQTDAGGLICMFIGFLFAFYFISLLIDYLT